MWHRVVAYPQYYDLLKDVEQAEFGIQLSSGKRIGGMLLADDFVGVSDSKTEAYRCDT